MHELDELLTHLAKFVTLLEVKAFQLPLFATFMLCGCTAPDALRQPAPVEPKAKAVAQITQAVITPLEDLNLVRADIPPVLAAAHRGAYAAPADRSCPALAIEIEGLDAALGADLDIPATASNPGLVERGTAVAGDAAIGAIRGAAEGVIPFRSWVRKLTGAERYSREVAAAIAAGTIRRAYLKGLGQAAGCQAPAAPRI